MVLPVVPPSVPLKVLVEPLAFLGGKEAPDKAGSPLRKISDRALTTRTQ